MSQLQESISRYRKMASDDPNNEIGHYRLGQLLAEAGQHQEAVQSFRRTLEISPEFSKVFLLLGTSLIQLGQKADAVRVLRDGFAVADERGDTIPRDEMVKLLVQLGEPAPVSKKTAREPGAEGRPATGDGFRCQRPGCMAGSRARRLPTPPMNDDIGRRIEASICADCWTEWFRNYSIKVINEMRLDLSTERGQEEYDQIMRQFLGFE
jgi:tetratricopeptide (TPR) repeat protein